MSTAFLIQLAASGIAVGALVALARWARIARPSEPLDEAQARRLLGEEFPGRTIESLWIGSDGAAALAKAEDVALVLCRVGDGWAARQVPWARALGSRFRDGRLTLDLADVAAPRAAIALPAWPPTGLGA